MMHVMFEGTPAAALTGPLLDATMQASSAPTVAWDLEGCVLASNEACRVVLGYSPDAMSTLRRPDLFHPDERRSVEARLLRRREGDREVEVFTARLWTANKRVVHVGCRSVPVIAGGEVVGDVDSYGVAELTLGSALDRQTEQYSRYSSASPMRSTCWTAGASPRG